MEAEGCRSPKKASRQSRSAAEVSPHSAGEAYDNIATTMMHVIGKDDIQ